MSKKKSKLTEDQEMNEKNNSMSQEADSELQDIDNQEEIEEKDKQIQNCGDIEELKLQYRELNDKYLRLYAEFDNYRKRTSRERIEFSKTASADIIASLLPVLDDLERALQAFGQSNDNASMKEGISLIYNKFKNILTKNGLEEIPSLGQTFNTDIHEAIANLPAESEDKKGLIMDQVEKGYYLNGKVLRFAKVVVAN